MEREKIIEWLKEMGANESSIFSIEYIDNNTKEYYREYYKGKDSILEIVKNEKNNILSIDRIS